jgi:LuxR family transcriptional regulator, maltose regulon positive regulatory protein
MESEFLSRISPGQRAFLTRTAVLERMCGPLCEAVLEAAGSAAVLADLAGANLPLVPLDRRGEWYRYHHLLRDMLLAALQRREPVLRHRAAGWYLRNGWPEDALECSMAAEDVDGAARLVGQLAVPAHRQGRITTLRRWFSWLEDRDGIEGYLMVAVLASLFSGLMGSQPPAGGEPMRSIAGRMRTQPAPVTLRLRRGPPCSRAILCRRGPNRCAPTQTRPCAGLRRRAS